MWRREFGFDFHVKADVLYKLMMPDLDEIQGAEVMQTGKSNDFELFRLLSRKIDPSRDDLASDMRTELQGLGKHTCRDVLQTFRFVAISSASNNSYDLFITCF